MSSNSSQPKKNQNQKSQGGNSASVKNSSAPSSSSASSSSVPSKPTSNSSPSPSSSSTNPPVSSASASSPNPSTQNAEPVSTSTPPSKPAENFWASRSQNAKQNVNQQQTNYSTTNQSNQVPSSSQQNQQEEDYLAKFNINSSASNNFPNAENSSKTSNPSSTSMHRNEGSGQYYSEQSKPQNLTLFSHFEGKLNLGSDPTKKNSKEKSENSKENTETLQKNRENAEGPKRSAAQQAEDETPSRVLWVGNISNSVTENDLQNSFGTYGKINSIRVLHNRFCAFINFESEEAAKTAKTELSGAPICGQNVIVNFRKSDSNKNNSNSSNSSNNNNLNSNNSNNAHNSNPVNLNRDVNSNANGQNLNGNPENAENISINKPSRSLWIGNISPAVSEEELRNEFAVFGPIDSIRLLKPKTCAFVNFKDAADAQRALTALQGKVLADLPIKINFGKKKYSNREENYYGGMMPYPMGMMGGYGMNEYGYPQPPYVGGPYPPQPFLPPQGYPPMMYDPALMYYNFVRCEVCGLDQKQVLFQPCMHASCAACAKSENCPLCKTRVEKYLEISFAPMPYDPNMMGPPAPYSPNDGGNQREQGVHGY